MTLIKKRLDIDAVLTPGKIGQFNVIADGRTYAISITSRDDNYPGDATYTYVDDMVFNGAAAQGDVHIVANLAK